MANVAEKLIEKIEHDFDNERFIEINRAIILYVVQNINSLKHISIGTLKLVTKNKYLDAEILEAAIFLTKSTFPILEIKYEFVDDETDESFEIDQNTFKDIINTGQFFNPKTGHPVEDFDKRIFIYFIPSANLITLTAR